MQKRSLAEILTGAVVLAVAAAFLVYAVSGSGRALTTSGMSLTARFDRIDGLAKATVAQSGDPEAPPRDTPVKPWRLRQRRARHTPAWLTPGWLLAN